MQHQLAGGFHPVTSRIRAPISEGLSTTQAPASRKAARFASAVPLPPATIAPACPMRFPYGADT
ncbi:MAG: hypothetical protein J4F97_01235, partial [Pseudomonadales bacterium]|nr:hypothetical protein [Pseudomonadales bacterium]